DVGQRVVDGERVAAAAAVDGQVVDYPLQAGTDQLSTQAGEDDLAAAEVGAQRQVPGGGGGAAIVHRQRGRPEGRATDLDAALDACQVPHRDPVADTLATDQQGRGGSEHVDDVVAAGAELQVRPVEARLEDGEVGAPRTGEHLHPEGVLDLDDRPRRR